jgi:hypothetical protein
MRGTTNHPWSRPQENPDAINSPGGTVIVQTATGQTLVGDAVYASAAHTVTKSNTPADYKKFVGIVVGGTATGMQVAETVGLVAANAGESLLIAISGIANAIADAPVAASALLAGGAVTAGRLDDSASATAGQIVGLSLAAAGAAGDSFPILIKHL